MPTLSGLGLPSEKSTISELIDHIAMLHKTIEYYLGNLDSANVREIGGWHVGSDVLASKSGSVGLSTAAINPIAGNNVRMWAGSTDMETAAFRVYESGKLVATNAEITGGTISWGAVGAPLFTDIMGPKPTIDADHTDTIITVNGSNFTKVAGAYVYSGPADYNQITGSKPPSNADNTAGAMPASLGINYTKIGSTYIYTGTLSANQINAGTINANYIKGGEISSVDINVSNDVTIGNNLNFNPGESFANKGLNFYGRGSLTFRTNGVTLSAYNQLDLDCDYVSVRGARIATETWASSNVIAKYG